MTLVAHVSVPGSDVLIGDLLSRYDDLEVDLLEMVPTGDDHVPYVRATGDEATLRSFERNVREDDRVAFLCRLDDGEGWALYRFEWVGPPDGFLEACITEELIVEDAVGTPREWHFRLLVTDREALTSFHRRCRDNGIPVRLRRVYDRENTGDRVGWGLTDAQHEAITLARRRGYFAVPRETTLTELADDLGISHQAMSGRLRRGLETLVDGTLMTDIDVLSEKT